MQATNTLVRLGQRLKVIRTVSNQEEGKMLLGWIQEGGLDSLKEGLVAFLTAAATQPAGSVFYVADEIKEQTLEEDVDRVHVADELRGRSDNIDAIMAEMKEHKEFQGERNLRLFAAYLAGWGIGEEGQPTVATATPEQIQEWFDEFVVVQPDDEDVMAFIKGYNNTELIRLADEAKGVDFLLAGKDNPFERSSLVDVDVRALGWYLAGRGYTYKTLENINGLDATELLNAYKAVSDKDYLSLFLQGYEEGPYEEDNSYGYDEDPNIYPFDF